MASALDIGAKTRKVDVDNRLSLRFYYRTAANLLRQASIYRDEHNVIDLYILLVRFSSLVSETIPDHRDYRTASLRERAEYKKKLIEVLSELESLQPEVHKQVERINRTRRLPPPTASVDEWAEFTSQFPTARRGTATIEQEANRDLSRIGSVDYHDPQPSAGNAYHEQQPRAGNTYHEQQPRAGNAYHEHQPRAGNAYHEQQPRAGDTYPAQQPRAGNAGDYWSSPSVVNTLDSRFANLSMNIPRARDETLSRHSFLGSNVPRRQTYSAPFRAQYPNNINATLIEMPSLEQSWRGPSQQPHRGYQRSQTGPALSEPVLWPEADTLPFPGGYSPLIGPDVAPVPSLIRQPDPPPVAAPVQTLESRNHSYTQFPPETHSHTQLPPENHSYTQVPPERVADPRPGSPQRIEDDLDEQKGTKHLHISTRMMEEFLALSRLNTQKNLETCAVLAGSLKKGVFYVSALIVPKQEATSDSCQTVNEEEIFDVQDKRGLFQLGWIHTHPTQTCFMSSIDLHTHYSYQIMLQEAIAIVMAPTDAQRKYGIFRLSDPGGVKSIQQCEQRGFHPHEEPEDGSPIYEHCSHVFMSPKLRFDVIDLRES